MTPDREETMDQVIPQMRVMDNGTGFGLNYALPEKEQPKPTYSELERKSQLHVSGSQL
jgi:hypothetical protein